MRFLVLLLVCACSTTIRVSRDELQANVEDHFPKEIDKHVVAIRLSDPEVTLPGSLFVIRVRVEATTFTGRSAITGVACVEGELEYRDQAFYLREPRVTQLDLDPATGPGHAARLVNRVDITAATRAVVVDVLSRHPIYRLKDPKAVRHLRSARVEDGSLLLKVGW
jgi:hypothetical protein